MPDFRRLENSSQLRTELYFWSIVNICETHFVAMLTPVLLIQLCKLFFNQREVQSKYYALVSTLQIDLDLTDSFTKLTKNATLWTYSHLGCCWCHSFNNFLPNLHAVSLHFVPRKFFCQKFKFLQVFHGVFTLWANRCYPFSLVSLSGNQGEKKKSSML